MVNCQINNEGARILSEMLKTNQTIVNLNLETNKIGPEGVIALSEAFKVNKTLKEVKITNQVFKNIFKIIFFYFFFKLSMLTWEMMLKRFYLNLWKQMKTSFVFLLR